MPSINTSDIIRASDSTYFVDISRVKKFMLTYLLTCGTPQDDDKMEEEVEPEVTENDLFER